mmetsp:Transcript_108462/g.231598  ORF Transcript_108462/g.231598 Transcript_108462/m.231598 type:complete len:220 (-) Transcript_108462:1260-1919(-)
MEWRARKSPFPHARHRRAAGPLLRRARACGPATPKGEGRAEKNFERGPRGKGPGAVLANGRGLPRLPHPQLWQCCACLAVGAGWEPGREAELQRVLWLMQEDRLPGPSEDSLASSGHRWYRLYFFGRAGPLCEGPDGAVCPISRGELSHPGRRLGTCLRQEPLRALYSGGFRSCMQREIGLAPRRPADLQVVGPQCSPGFNGGRDGVSRHAPTCSGLDC